MNVLLLIGFAVLIGLMATRLAKKCGLPAVTAYLISGVIIGPFCLGRLGIGFDSEAGIATLKPVSDAALGFIAFSIGNEFRLATLKKIGRQAIAVGIVQALVASLFVDAALIGLHFIIPDKLSLASAITLGAVAAATAPAATLMVVKQYKARGKVTEILLPVVALDDAVGLAVFSVSFGVARAICTGHVDMLGMVLEPLGEIVLSLGLGALLGLLLTHLEKFFNSNKNRLSLVICFVLMTVGISKLQLTIFGFKLSFSPLLVCMMLGSVFCNLCPLSFDLMDRADAWTAPLYALFFLISGAELELDVFADGAIVLIGVVYIAFRCMGKCAGSYVSCKAAGCDPEVTRWLGITLFPQAGVALGMAVTVAATPEIPSADALLIRSIILFSVLIYELVGPALTKYALTRSGDIVPASEEVRNRRNTMLERKNAERAAK